MLSIIGAIGFSLLLTWAVGVAVTLVLLDRGCGWARDHPPYRYRLAGLVPVLLGGLALLAALPAAAGFTRSGLPWWCKLSIPWALPFVSTSLVYAASWWAPSWAWIRRGWGAVTAVAGVGGVVVLAHILLGTVQPDWRWAVPGGVFAASVLQLGSLTLITVNALAGARRDEVAEAGHPYGVPAVLFSSGALVTLLVLTDIGSVGNDVRAAGASAAVAAWAVLAFLLPLVLFAAGHCLWPRLRRAIWPLTLGVSLAGTLFAQAVVMLYPGLVPPPPI